MLVMTTKWFSLTKGAGREESAGSNGVRTSAAHQNRIIEIGRDENHERRRQKLRITDRSSWKRLIRCQSINGSKKVRIPAGEFVTNCNKCGITCVQDF